MARVRILPLPAVQVGSSRRTPFVIVLDRTGQVYADHEISRLDREAKALGANGVIFYAYDLELDV